MRLLLLSLLLSLLASCSRSTAGITLPAEQQFLLGEYMDRGYRASLINRGPQSIEVRLRDRVSQTTERQLTLTPGQRESLRVADHQEVLLVNASDRAGQVTAKLSTTVRGMRMQTLAGGEVPPTAAEAPPVPATGPIVIAPNAGPARLRVDTLLPAGRQLIVGEGSSTSYSATVRHRGGAQFDVSVRDKRTGRQTQGFGLGRNATETVHLRPHEDLHLVNTSGEKAARVTVKLSDRVRGARLTEARR